MYNVVSSIKSLIKYMGAVTGDSVDIFRLGVKYAFMLHAFIFWHIFTCTDLWKRIQFPNQVLHSGLINTLLLIYVSFEYPGWYATL